MDEVDELLTKALALRKRTEMATHSDEEVQLAPDEGCLQSVSIGVLLAEDIDKVCFALRIVDALAHRHQSGIEDCTDKIRQCVDRIFVELDSVKGCFSNKSWTRVLGLKKPYVRAIKKYNRCVRKYVGEFRSAARLSGLRGLRWSLDSRDGPWAQFVDSSMTLHAMLRERSIELRSMGGNKADRKERTPRQLYVSVYPELAANGVLGLSRTRARDKLTTDIAIHAERAWSLLADSERPWDEFGNAMAALANKLTTSELGKARRLAARIFQSDDPTLHVDVRRRLREANAMVNAAIDGLEQLITADVLDSVATADSKSTESPLDPNTV